MKFQIDPFGDHKYQTQKKPTQFERAKLEKPTNHSKEESQTQNELTSHSHINRRNSKNGNIKSLLPQSTRNSLGKQLQSKNALLTRNSLTLEQKYKTQIYSHNIPLHLFHSYHSPPHSTKHTTQYSKPNIPLHIQSSTQLYSDTLKAHPVHSPPPLPSTLTPKSNLRPFNNPLLHSTLI